MLSYNKKRPLTSLENKFNVTVQNGTNEKKQKNFGPSRDLNPGPLAPEAKIIPLDHLAVAMWRLLSLHITTRKMLYDIMIFGQWFEITVLVPSSQF